VTREEKDEQGGVGKKKNGLCFLFFFVFVLANPFLLCVNLRDTYENNMCV
jgi:hypothetical protein